MIRYAVVGTSGITQQFIRAADRTGRMVLQAVFSRDVQRGAAFAAQWGAARSESDWPLFCNSADFDAVYVASPNALHFKQCEQLLNAGKHVLCEKPATVTYGEARKLTVLAKQQGRIYLEAIMGLHLPERDILREALCELGTVAHARLDFSQLSSKYPAYQAGQAVNIFDPSLAAGALMDLGVYCVYPALDLFGEPTATHTEATFLRTGADGMGVSLWTYPDTLVTLSWCKTGQGECGSEIVGDRGTIRFRSISLLQEITLHKPDGSVTVLSSPRDKVAAMSFEAHAFCDCIEQPMENAERYAEATMLRERVSFYMEQMRQQAKLPF